VIAERERERERDSAEAEGKKKPKGEEDDTLSPWQTTNRPMMEMEQQVVRCEESHGSYIEKSGTSHSQSIMPVCIAAHILFSDLPALAWLW
jgi:hypothetical protein